MIQFATRNLKLYFRDRAAVFFSLLGVLIIIGLYLLFLGEVWIQEFENAPGARFLMNSWIMAGVLAISSFTSSMGAYGTMIEDRANSINRDFVASPVKNTTILGGYILNGLIVGVIMSLFTLVVAELFIVAQGGELFSLPALLKVLGLILLAAVSNSALVIFLISFLKTLNAFSTASMLIGTLIGFVTGIYLPIGNFPTVVQWIVKLFPVSHAAVLFRQVMMERPMEITFTGAPQGIIEQFLLNMGINFDYNGVIAQNWVHIAVLLASTVIFYLLALLNLSRKAN